MTRALVLKELHQHWLALVLITLAAVCALPILLGVILLSEAGSMFEVLRVFLIGVVPLMAMVLGNRLVVREYQAKTQLFLEALPLRRIHMVLVKYVFGLSLVAALTAAVLVLVLPLSARSEQPTYRFLLLVSARTAGYTWCVYSFFFVMGLLGRYRIAIYLALGLCLLSIENLTSLELSRFGPFALVNDQFSFERTEVPVKALSVTLGLAAGFSLLALLLSLIHEGSVATMLAEKMSHREKVFVSCIVIGMLFSVTLYDQRAIRKPFDLPGAVVEQSGDVTVKISLGAFTDEAPGRELARFVVGELAALQEYLETSELPPTFIVQRRDLDPDRYELGVLDGAHGLLVRANFQHEKFDQHHFLAWLIRESLALKTRDRAIAEPGRWVLDGLGDFWVHRQRVREPLESIHSRLALRATYGTSLGFSARDLQDWLTFRERVGPELATAVAWSGLVTLARSSGDEPCREFIRTVIGPNVPTDARATVYAWRNPWPKVLERSASVAAEPFLARWQSELAACAKTLERELATVPRPRGTIQFVSVSPDTRKVTFDFRCDPAPPSGRFVLRYATLPPFNAQVPDHELKQEDRQFEESSRGELPATYARGTRFYSTFAVRDDRMGCEIITGWTRREME